MYNVGINPNVSNSTGRAQIGIDLTKQQMPNPQPMVWYKLIKKMGDSDHVEVITKSRASCPPKLAIMQLHDEFANLIELGVLNAALIEMSGSDFKLSFVHNGCVVEIFYELIMETERETAHYDPMI